MKLKTYIFVCLLPLICTVLIPGISAAQNTTHQVEAGDTLFGIADEYAVSVQQLREWNSLEGSQLSIGQQLVIKKQASKAGITHTVEPKETLFSISKKYSVSISQIKQWNDLDGRNLAVGTTLTIYPEQSTNESTGDNQSPSGSYYTVKSGDSLFRIARLHNMSIAQLKQINNLTSSNIRVGQRLAVQATDRPPSLAKTGVESSAQGKFIRYEVEKSQSRTELLETFAMDEAEFSALNPGLEARSFRRGDAVNILAPPTRTFSNPYTTDSGLRTLGTAGVSTYNAHAAEPTTSGELYNPEALTAGHSNIAMGSLIFIKNNTNNRGIYVRINDRITGSGLRLSAAAWRTLALSGDEASVTMFSRNE